MTDILEIDDVILEFHSLRVLNGIYMKSETGKITGILGRNGSGKSCLFKILFGTLSAQQKSMRINGVHSTKPNAKKIKYLPQFEFLPKSIKLKQAFNNFRVDLAHFLEVFPEFNVHQNSKLSALSGGERRIVEIYCILTSESQFCLLDEPFSQIMPLHVDKIKHLILREKQNKGIMISDHLYEHIVDISNDIYLLNEGRTFPISDIQELDQYGYVNLKKHHE